MSRMAVSGPGTEASLETSVLRGTVPLASILRTEELRRRPTRAPDYGRENRALASLVIALADSPRTILHVLADKVLEVLQADSAGLSLLTKDETRFYWAAIAGSWSPHVGGGTPRTFGPCGDVLDNNAPMLFTHWERRYPYLSTAIPLADEGLLVPFHVNGRPVGTIWAIAHDTNRQFDAEDLRLLESMSRFASAAYQALQSIENLKLEIVAREAAETAVRELANGLETQVRVRTQELERSTEELLAANQELEREIAERKRVEQELRRSEAFLADAQRLSLTGSFAWDLSTGEIAWSNQLYQIFGMTPGESVSIDAIRSRVHPDDAATVDAVIGGMSSERGDYEFEHRLLMPDESVRYVRVVAHAIQDVDGGMDYVGAVQDVTEHKNDEAALNKARAELAHVARVTSLGTLTASIAHEVNQPLSGIITNASTCLRMLVADPPNVDGARETARRTIRDGHRASDVITRLRVLFARKELTPEPVDINDAARDVLALSMSDLQRGQVVLRTELADHLPIVRGDRIQLQQVILNLLRNAIDAMSGVRDRPRELVVRTEAERDVAVRLSVRDSGVGIPSDTVHRVFEAFYTTKGAGMGIGLSVSKSIVESHGGSLGVIPNGEGHGATFSFSIPCDVSARC